MAGYLFGGNTGISYTDLQRRREMAEALSKQLMGDTPKTTAQGIGALIKGVGAGIGRYTANKGIKEGSEKANSAYDSILGSLMGGASTGSPQAMPSSASAGGIPMPGAASEIAATSPRTVDISGNKQTFIDSLLPAAIEEGRRTGVDPRLIVAQAAQETGWGKSAPGNNYFGIKSHGQSGGNSLMTTEYVNGQKVNVRDSFRGYESPADSVRGYGDFITQNKRYKPLREAQGLDAQLEALQASGYATDPNYSKSVGAIARSINLPNEVASLDASIGVPYQPSIEPQDPNAEARRQEAMKQIVGSQPNASGAVNAMGQGGVQPSAYVDPMVSAQNAPRQQPQAPQQAPQQVAQNGQFRAPQQAPTVPQAPANPFGGADPKLLQLMSNPFLDPDKKAIIQNVIQQQMQAGESARQEQQWRARQEYQTQQQRNDPAYQLEMETKRAQLEALQAKPQKQWQKLDDGTLFNPETAEVKKVGGNPDGSTQFRFGGNSVEAQALNGLMQSGALTEAQAQQLGAGKTISGPNGEIIFMTPQGVFGKSPDGSVSPMPGGQATAPQPPQSVDIFAGTPETSPAAVPQPVAPQQTPQPAPQVEQRPGMIPLTQGQGLDDKGRERRQMAIENGLDPNSDEGKRFILTGTLPASDRGVTAGDREAIRDADDQAQASRSAIDQLQSVIAPREDNGLSLNDRAGSGALADWQAWAARNDPTGFFDDAKGEATTELSNTVLGQALGSLKSIFGAAPTEGERQILLDMQASVDKTPAERKIIIDKAIALANRKLKYQQDRATDLRGGDYYKSNRGQPNVQTNAPSTPAEAMGLPSIDGPTPNKRLRFNPATGDFE